MGREHTEEKWETTPIDGADAGCKIVDMDGNIIAFTNPPGPPIAVCRERAVRIVQCVEACRDIPSPEGVKGLVEVLEAVRGDAHFYMLRHSTNDVVRKAISNLRGET